MRGLFVKRIAVCDFYFLFLEVFILMMLKTIVHLYQALRRNIGKIKDLTHAFGGLPGEDFDMQNSNLRSKSA